jgi:nitroreductase
MAWESEMDVIAAIHGRRSVRSYEPRPVERDLIEAVIEDAAQAPPPFRGLVPWAFNVVEGGERIAACGARAMDYARAQRSGQPGWDWLDRPGF